MKRLLTLMLAMAFPILLIGEPTTADDFIYTQYQIFEHERGIKSFNAAQTIMDTIGNVIGKNIVLEVAAGREANKAILLKSMINYYSITEEFDKVFTYAKIAIPFYQGRNDRINVAGCYHAMGISSQYLGHFDDAIRYYQLCSDLIEEIGGPMADRNRRYETNNMASIYLILGDCDQAEKMYYTCIDLLGDVGNDTLANRDLATYYQNLVGVWLTKISKMDPNDDARHELTDKAVDYAEQSLSLSTRYGDFEDKKALRRITLSKAYFEAGRKKEAYGQADSAMIIIQSLGLKAMEASVYSLKGDYAYRMGQFDSAEEYYIEAASLAEEHHLAENCMENYHGAYLSTKKSHPERSIEYLERYNAWRDTIYSQEKQNMISEYQVKYQIAEKERKSLLQQVENDHFRHRIAQYITVIVLLIVIVGVLVLIIVRRKKQNEALQQRDRFKDHLFSIVSHDIKAPIEGQVQLLNLICEHIKTMQPEELMEGLLAMKTSSENLKNKVINVNYWIKEKLGGSESKPVLFNLNEITQVATRDLATMISIKNLTVINKIANDWMGFDDINLIRIVTQNILSNAVKFSSDNSEITINATEDGTRYWIIIADQGKGISKDKLDKLQKEIIAPDHVTQGEMGTGIGLYVSSQMIQRLGGEIVINSTENIGTTVSFPVNKA